MYKTNQISNGVNHILTLNPTSLRLPRLGPRFGLRTWLVFSLALMIFLSAFYIFQVNELTKAGFFISSHERQIAEFSRESQILEVNFSQLNSLANLETVLSKLNYEEIGKVHYLRLPGVTVLAK